MSSDHTTASNISNANNPQNGAGRPLPKKEADIFKNLVKQYEMKQYKKALKHADMILKKFPNHGETLAMKGLIVNNYNTNTNNNTSNNNSNKATRNEEAHALVKLGLKNDMRSHVCWHVYGLLHRSDHDYNEAIKAYKQALKVDATNLQILRDLSMLQIQLRDIHGFVITRNTLLSLKPNAKINWMAYALARHLNKDYTGAINVIDIYLGTLTEGSIELGRSYESSELALYKNSIIAEIPNNYQAALDHLHTCESIVVDRGVWLKKKLIYQLKLQQFIPAQSTIYQLFDRGMTEDHTIHSLYMCQVLQQLDHTIIDEVLQLRGTQTLATYIPLSTEQKQKLYDAYQNDLQNKYPKSDAVQRIPITFLDDHNPDQIQQFRYFIDRRCRRDIRKGVPSLCAELKSYLYTVSNGRYIHTIDPVDIKIHPKYQVYTDLIDTYITNLELYSKYTKPDNDDTDSNNDEEEEEPSTLFWAWYVRAGLCAMVNDYVEGIQYINKCIHHTPTAIDAYEMKALLLKQCGNINTAVQCLDYGRNLDRADRYLNNITTKYMLQANMEVDALQRISMFTKHEGNPEQNLYDMQCSWYEIELANCYERKLEYGKKFKKYHAVIQHFHDFHEDQFDFHSYCLRKVTLCSYISLLRYEDVIYGEEYFTAAASGTIRIYLRLYDVPTSQVTDEPDYSNMDSSERKKAKAIARKKKKASEKMASSTTTTTNNNSNNNSKENDATTKSNGTTSTTTATNTNTNTTNKGAILDDDPYGLKFTKKDPLQEATKYSNMLIQYAPYDVQSWITLYDVSIRRNKLLLALRALYKAHELYTSSHTNHTMNQFRHSTRQCNSYCEIFTRVVDFKSKLGTLYNIDNKDHEIIPMIRTVINIEMSKLMNNLSLYDYVMEEINKCKNDIHIDLPMRIAIIKAYMTLPNCCSSSTADISDDNNKNKMQLYDLVQQVLVTDGMKSRNVTYETCNEGLTLLQSLGNDDNNTDTNKISLYNDMIQQWEVEFRKRFPIITEEETAINNNVGIINNDNSNNSNHLCPDNVGQGK